MTLSASMSKTARLSWALANTHTPLLHRTLQLFCSTHHERQRDRGTEGQREGGGQTGQGGVDLQMDILIKDGYIVCLCLRITLLLQHHNSTYATHASICSTCSPILAIITLQSSGAAECPLEYILWLAYTVQGRVYIRATTELLIGNNPPYLVVFTKTNWLFTRKG